MLEGAAGVSSCKADLARYKLNTYSPRNPVRGASATILGPRVSNRRLERAGGAGRSA